MIKRTLEISAAPVHLTSRQNQLLLMREGETLASFPCEDLGVVLVEHPGTTYTHAAFTSLIDSQATVLFCGRDHLPKGILLPLSDHSQVVWRIHDQLEIGKPLAKQLWAQLVRAKIEAQRANLLEESAAYRKLRQFAKEVRSGDPDNREAQAAKVYWQNWLAHYQPSPGQEVQFQRNPDGAAPNSLLNYGYAVMRACVARALVSAGLLPALGLHHCNRSNPFCLADDLMEPLRPIVDEKVRELYWGGETEVNQPTKAALLELLTLPVNSGPMRTGLKSEPATGPLFVAVQRMVASLVNCYQGKEKLLEIPTRCVSVDTVACG